jgi:Ran GTPase-activating protein (RanGAP) involved in mRNA processing and transport
MERIEIISNTLTKIKRNIWSVIIPFLRLDEVIKVSLMNSMIHDQISLVSLDELAILRRERELFFPDLRRFYHVNELIEGLKDYTGTGITLSLWDKNSLDDAHKIATSLATCHSLRHLSLKDVNYLSIILDQIKDHPKLESLWILNLKFDGMKILIHPFKNIRFLNLFWRDHEIDDLLFQSLEHNNYLKMVRLQATQIVKLNENTITKSLQGNTTLISLVIHEMRFKVDSIHDLSTGLSLNISLLEIILYQCELNDEQIEIFCQGFKLNKKIKCLQLGRNTFTNIGANSLSDVLKTKKNMQEICILNDKISIRGIITLATAFRNLRNLEVADLITHCKLLRECSVEELTNIFKFVESNTLIKEICLKHLINGDEILKILYKLISKHTQIESLWMENCNLTDESGKELEMIIQSNPIRQLLLSSNFNFGAKGLYNICRALTNKTTFKYLLLKECNLTNESVPILQHFLKTRKSHCRIILVNTKITEENQLILKNMDKDVLF